MTIEIMAMIPHVDLIESATAYLMFCVMKLNKKILF
jgi:hypothetical protein